MPKLKNCIEVYRYLGILQIREENIIKICQLKIDKLNYHKVRKAYYLVIKIRDTKRLLISFLKTYDESFFLKYTNIDFKPKQ